MQKLKSFISTSFLGGVLVILPVSIVIALFVWLYDLLVTLVRPLSDVLTTTAYGQKTLADIIAVISLFALCFFLGLLVKTRLGSFAIRFIENNILSNVPGYGIIKDTVGQFLGGQQAQFSRVAVAKIFSDDVLSTVFITATHRDGSYTVFLPTAPNPTSGLVFHLPANKVIPVDITIDRAMRTIIACGAGSQAVLEKMKSKT